MADRVARKMRKVSQEAPPRRRIEAEGAGFEIDLRGLRAPRCDDPFIPLIKSPWTLFAYDYRFNTVPGTEMLP